jgi:hypothetical protein
MRSISESALSAQLSLVRDPGEIERLVVSWGGKTPS